jgi:hypothetical protein
MMSLIIRGSARAKRQRNRAFAENRAPIATEKLPLTVGRIRQRADLRNLTVKRSNPWRSEACMILSPGRRGAAAPADRAPSTLGPRALPMARAGRGLVACPRAPRSVSTLQNHTPLRRQPRPSHGRWRTAWSRRLPRRSIPVAPASRPCREALGAGNHGSSRGRVDRHRPRPLPCGKSYWDWATRI